MVRENYGSCSLLSFPTCETCIAWINLCGVVILCVLSFLQPPNSAHVTNERSYLENSSTVQAGFMPRGTWQNPQGKKRATRSAAKKRERPRGATHTAHRHKKSSQMPGTVQTSTVSPLTTPFVVRGTLLVWRWTRRQLRLKIAPAATALTLWGGAVEDPILLLGFHLFNPCLSSSCFESSRKIYAFIFAPSCTNCCISASFFFSFFFRSPL